jgi:hypothetical protein
VLRYRSPLVGLAASVGSVALITLLIYPLREVVPVVSTGVVYFHIPPTGGFTIAERENWVAHAADVAWALEHAPGEVLVLRPGDGLTAPHPSAEAT